MTPRARATALVIACAIVAVPLTVVSSGNQPFMALGKPTFPPGGFVEFCSRRPDECDIDPSFAADEPVPEKRRTELWVAQAMRVVGKAAGALFGAGDPPDPKLWRPTAEEWNRVEAVNREINRAIRPTEDGKLNTWSLPLTQAGGGAVGDCEDFVLEKRRRLRAEGVPAAALSIATVELRNGIGHAVLVVTTVQGDYILDNLSSWVTPWRKSSYAAVSRQAPGRPLEWVTATG